jgi:hypothetical protein
MFFLALCLAMVELLVYLLTTPELAANIAWLWWVVELLEQAPLTV